MPNLGYAFNANEVAERKDFAPVPNGRYRVMATASQMKPTKAGTGEYLEYELDVQAPAEHQGRKLFVRLNLKNPNPEAERIAHEELGEMTRACGKTVIQASEELHNIAFDVEVEIEPGKPYTKDGVQQEGKPQNRIAKYLPANGAAPSARPATAFSQPQANQQTAVQTSNAATPPWKRK